MAQIAPRSNPSPLGAEVEFSIIVSCYFEEKSIEEFHSRLSATLEKLGREYEIIYVNDGSTDGTLSKLKAIYDRDRRVFALIDLFKNSGQANAKTPGITVARGRAIVLIDSDLQLDPEELPSLVKKYDQGYDIVSGRRGNRRDSLFRRAPSKLANLIMRKASGSKLSDFGCTFKIYDGRLVRAFDFGVFKPWRPVPVISLAGKIAEVPVNHHPRKYGKSGWTFRKLFAYNMENLVNISEKPFQILATACLLLAALFAARIALGWIFKFSVLPKVTLGLILNSLVVSLLLLLMTLCVIGELVIRNFIVLQRRPAYVVKTILKRDPQ